MAMVNGRTKLTDEQVTAIKASSKPLSEIAEEFGIGARHVLRIRHGLARKRNKSPVAKTKHKPHPRRKLTDDQVRHIRQALGLHLDEVERNKAMSDGRLVSGVSLAKRFGVDNATISQIRNWKTHKGVTA